MKTCPQCGKEYGDTNTLCPADGAVLKREDELVGRTLIGKYRIDEKISEGGMGCVYRATHVLMEKSLAVKVLHPALAADENIVARFTREAKAASRISHPHAIVVTDFGESEDGVVFLVMEYLRGRTLKEVVRAEGPMALERATEIVRQVAGALDAAHNEGVVHRDLKSDNIMLDETAAGGDWAKVLDFGIAKIKEKIEGDDPGLTSPNLIIGTPQYMSPEQCSQASNIDSRTDIYSLGIILYEMLVGHVPFTGDSPTEIMMKHMQEPPPPLISERGDLSASVGEIVQKALAKNPDERFQTAGELSEAMNTANEEARAAALAANRATGDGTTDGRGVLRTSRIVVTTGENEAPRSTGSAELDEDEDESTVVTARRRTGQYAPAPPPPAPESFNPWRIAVPAVILLGVVFGLFYYLQGNNTSSESQVQPTAPVSGEPGSRPVVTVTPPTGASERNLPASSVSATPTPGEAAASGLLTDIAPSASPSTTETPAADADVDEETTPTPTPTRRAPTPPPSATDATPAPTPANRTGPTPPPPVKGDPPVPIGPVVSPN